MKVGSEVEVRIGGVTLQGILGLPERPLGVVLFAHGSGSSRFSPRNHAVAGVLQRAGLGTLLFDLLSEEEEAEDERTLEHRFNIRLLAERVAGTIDWLRAEEATRRLPIGCFGSSTGAAAALVAAAARPRDVAAVVSRGGRPDLAGDALAGVFAPTLLLVGGRDEPVLELNREAARRLPGERELRIIEGAGHLFEEPGSLEQVALLAAAWFVRHLRAGAAPELHV